MLLQELDRLLPGDKLKEKTVYYTRENFASITAIQVFF